MAAKKSAAYPYQWPDGSWHSKSWGAHTQAMGKPSGAGTVFIGNQAVTPEQYQSGALANAMTAPKPAAPAAPASAAGAAPTPALLPPDPTFDEEVLGYGRQRETTKAGLKGARSRGITDYGFTETAADPVTGITGVGAFDPNNPFSKAALLKRNYNESRARTGGQMALTGNLYAGAFQTSQDAINRGQLQGEDTLGKALAGFLTENATGIGQADTDYETSVAGAKGRSTERASNLQNPLYEPVADPVVGALSAPGSPAATVSAPNVKPAAAKPKASSGGSVYINGKRVTQAQWQRGDLLKAATKKKK